MAGMKVDRRSCTRTPSAPAYAALIIHARREFTNREGYGKTTHGMREYLDSNGTLTLNCDVTFLMPTASPPQPLQKKVVVHWAGQ